LLAGDAVAIGAGFGKEPKRVNGEAKFMLRDGQAAAVAFHGGFTNG
jgi:hypothetical protein